MKKYLKPKLLIIDELGFLPIDRRGSDLLFQVLSACYETGSVVITTNRAPNEWAKTFNNDITLAAGLADRILHHCHLLGNSRPAKLGSLKPAIARLQIFRRKDKGISHALSWTLERDGS